jgi:hypothetical protein
MKIEASEYDREPGLGIVATPRPFSIQRMASEPSIALRWA